MSTSPTRLVVERPEQLAALTSPVRLELLELFGMWGPCAIADVAELMDRAPDSLYYHVRKLLKVGLLVRDGERLAGHRFEALYKLVADELEVPRKAKGPKGREMTHKAIDSVLRLAGRELKSALEDDDALDQGPARTLYGRRLRARLSKAALRELNRHVAAVEELFAEATRKPPRAKNSVAVTLIMSPVPSREES